MVVLVRYLHSSLLLLHYSFALWFAALLPLVFVKMAPQMHTHYMGLAGTALQTAIAVTAGLCFVAFGYGQGDVGGLLIEESFMNYFPDLNPATKPVSASRYANYTGAIVSTWNIGCFVGAFFVIFIGDRLGRKGTVVTGLVIETIGKIIQCSSFGVGQYIAGRLIAGFGNGYGIFNNNGWLRD